jgi:hypothetical protein
MVPFMRGSRTCFTEKGKTEIEASYLMTWHIYNRYKKTPIVLVKIINFVKGNLFSEKLN